MSIARLPAPTEVGAVLEGTLRHALLEVPAHFGLNLHLRERREVVGAVLPRE